MTRLIFLINLVDYLLIKEIISISFNKKICMFYPKSPNQYGMVLKIDLYEKIFIYI